MGKININTLDYEDESFEYEAFTKRNKKKVNHEEDVFESQGEPPRGRKGDSYISRRTKART